jgi:hypothetical protein
MNRDLMFLIYSTTIVVAGIESLTSLRCKQYSCHPFCLFVYSMLPLSNQQ